MRSRRRSRGAAPAPGPCGPPRAASGRPGEGAGLFVRSGRHAGGQRVPTRAGVARGTRGSGYRAVGVAHPPAHRHERRAVPRRAAARNRTPGHSRGRDTDSANARRLVRASGLPGAPPPRRAGAAGAPLGGGRAVGHRDERAAGERAPDARDARRRAQGPRDHARPGGAREARSRPVSRGGRAAGRGGGDGRPVHGRGAGAGGRAAALALRLAAPRARPHRNARRMRARRVGRLHGAAGWRRGALVPDPRCPGGRARAGHGGRARPARRGRRAAPAAGRLPRGPRPAMRLLHSRPSDDARAVPARAPPPERAGDPRGALGAFVPLHRLPGHPRRRRARRRVRAVTATGRYLGARGPRNEDARLLTGRALFVDDVHLDGMLHVAFLRSDYAHALIRSVDLATARRRPGVVAAYTAADLGDYWRPGPLLVPPPPIPGLVFHARTQVPLAKDRVRHVGEPIAMVVAESRYVAEDALEDIVVDAEPLPAAGDPWPALAPCAPPLPAHLGSNVAAHAVQRKGDYARARAAAHVVIARRFRYDRWAAGSGRRS